MRYKKESAEKVKKKNRDAMRKRRLEANKQYSKACFKDQTSFLKSSHFDVNGSYSIECEKVSYEFTKVVQGSCHQGDATFKYAGLQCTFMCLRAITENIKDECCNWKGFTCDKILKCGNQMYEDYIDKNGKNASLLLINQLPHMFTVENSKYDLRLFQSYTGIVWETADNPPYFSLETALCKGFDESKTLFLTYGFCTTALFKTRNNLYGVFDSHSRNNCGLPHCDGKSLLIFFTGIQNLLKYLESMFLSLNLNAVEAFELTPCKVSRNQLHAYFSNQSDQLKKLRDTKKSLKLNSINVNNLHGTKVAQKGKKRKANKRRLDIGLSDNVLMKKIKVVECFDRNSQALKKQSKKVCRKKRARHIGSPSDVSNLQTLITAFKSAVSKGPIYVCTCCHQTWFKESVVKVSLQHKNSSSSKYFTNLKSVSNKEWLCRTCNSNLKQNKMPVCAVFNNNKFPVKPKELMLTALEERLISPRIPFMQIRERPRGGQLSIKGNVVNVPSDVSKTVNSLPRPLSDSDTIAIKLKRKLSYQHCVSFETVRLSKVFQAAKFLVENSALFKREGICLNESFLTQDNSEEIQKFINGDIEETSTVTSYILNESNDLVIKDNDLTGNMDTLLQTADYSDKTLIFAPGEGNKPIGLFQDKDSEFLSFPTIYCGEKRPDNSDRHIPIHYSDICKWELRNIDRRVAACVPNIFFKLKKLQIKQIRDKVSTAIRKIKGQQDKKYTARDLLAPETINNLVKLNEGYRVLRTLRGSPPYFEQMKKDLFATIRQLGLPTFFCSLSAAETRWVALLKMLGTLNDQKFNSDEEIHKLSWLQKCTLIKKDPVTCARYFDYRVNKFIAQVLQSKLQPIGKMVDFFGRIEFQHRGSPHLHMLIWIENSPKFGLDDDEEVTQFIDKYISCKHDIDLESLVALQHHSCTRTCKKYIKKKSDDCRFHFPIPPMPQTRILQPLTDTASSSEHKNNFEKIISALKELKGNESLKFDDWLTKLDLTEEQYVNAIRSSLVEAKPFLKRQLNETRINCYNKTLLLAWEANLDLQYVTNAYACASYIVSYITKGQRGMSALLEQACEEAKEGNYELKQQVRNIGNKFLGAVEVSAQEAVYLVLQLPLRRSSRDVIFINTTSENERTFLLKSKAQLQDLPSHSTDIENDNIIKKYQRRPKALQNLCLADFVSWYNISKSNRKQKQNKEDADKDNLLPEDYISDGNEDDPRDESDEEIDENRTQIQYIMRGGVILKKRAKQKVIRYVRYKKDIDEENYCREQLMLFTSWRNEKNLIGSSSSYAEQYELFRTAINNVKSVYEKKNSDLEQVTVPVESECYNDFAPSTEYQNDLDEDEGSSVSVFHNVFDPGSEKNKEYDIGPDLGLNVQNNTFEIQTNLISEEKYFKIIQSLNKKQRIIFYHILHHFKTKDEPIYNFLTGGAGCGKTVVTKALYQALVRHFNKNPGENPDDIKVLLCAPTGKASYNIGGNTLHSTFHIPANQSLQYRKLDMQSLNTLRTHLHKLKVVFIDEVSMVGNKMLNFVHHRLCEIMGNTDYFGGVSIIAIGDLFQLQPVMDNWIFDDLQENYGPLATNLWKECFSVFELTTIMRQRENKSYAELLNRLREGNHTQADIDLLNSKTIKPNDRILIPTETTTLYTTNKMVDEHNMSVIQSLPVAHSKCCVKALDIVQNGSNSNNDKILAKLPKNPTKTMGLLNELNLGISLRFDVCLNIDVTDGLTNGASCTVTYLDYRHSPEFDRLSIVWCSFDDKIVGSKRRHQYSYLYKNNINPLWTPIFEVKRQILVGRNGAFTVIRSQFPLRPAAAKTIHKSQGDTVTSLAVHLGNRKINHIHYVALSRVTNIHNLYVLHLNESNISVSQKVKEEMNRLRTQMPLQINQPYFDEDQSTFKICFQNVRSLYKHIPNLRSEDNLLSVDLLGLAETWLRRDDKDIDFMIEGFTLMRCDNPCSGNKRLARGIAVYNNVDYVTYQHHTLKEAEYVVIKYPDDFKIPSINVVFLYVFPLKGSVTISRIIQILQNIQTKISSFEPVVILGDFNYDLNKYKQLAKCIKEIFKYDQMIKTSTTDSNTCIDHVYTNVPHFVKLSGTLESYYSDHKPIFVSLQT